MSVVHVDNAQLYLKFQARQNKSQEKTEYTVQRSWVKLKLAQLILKSHSVEITAMAYPYPTLKYNTNMQALTAE